MKHFLAFLVLASCLAAFPSGYEARTESEERTDSRRQGEAVALLEAWIESVLDFDRLPGMSIAIVHDQELAYAKGFGYADIERRGKATPDTIYSVCSISKIFTALAVMQLRDAKKLSLDDPVSEHLPWFAPQGVDPGSPPPTLRDLLRHSSGLPTEPDHTVWSDTDQLFPSRESLIERVSSLKMSYPTNTEFNYSNLGYSLLGEVVSEVSGMEFGDYLRENILEPLGMDATTPYPPTGLLGSKMAVGYGRWPRKGSRVKITGCDARAMTPAKGLASTVEDLAKFAMWQFRVLDGKDDIVLSRQTLMEMQAAQWSDPEWGLGFSIWTMGDSRFVGHQGGCPGFKSQIILNPEERIAVVVAVNATDAPQFTLVFRAHEIMAAALKATTAREDEPGKWAKYTGYYTADRSWSEAEVVEWDGSLSVMWIPTGNPVGSLERLRRVEGNVFRRVGSDGKLGKHYVFKSDAAGNIVGMRFNDNLLKKTVH